VRTVVTIAVVWCVLSAVAALGWIIVMGHGTRDDE